MAKAVSVHPARHRACGSREQLLYLVCFFVLCIIFTLGLWPFHSPRNQVTWLSTTSGVSFGSSGTVLSEGTLQTIGTGDETGSTLEIWAQPRPYLTSATLLAFYTPDNPYAFRVLQSVTDLRVQAALPNAPKNILNFYVSEVFRRAKPVFLTITSGRDGTKVYIAGALAAATPDPLIPKKAFTGQFLLGDSPLQPGSWSGQVRGLAIYDTELGSPQVSRHYETWMKNGRPDVRDQERNIALYLLDERAGSVIHNQVKSGVNLYIPARYVVIDKAFIEPIWREFSMSRSYWSAVTKNIVGFVPLGFCFYPLFLARQVRGPIRLTIALGSMVSFTIEVLQAFLPTRDSGMTDILTNSLGTWAGVLLFRCASGILAARFPWLSEAG